MSKNTDEPLHYPKVWACTNWGVPFDIAGTRTAAIARIEKHTGEPWAKCKSYMEARKVTLVEGWDK